MVQQLVVAMATVWRPLASRSADADGAGISNGGCVIAVAVRERQPTNWHLQIAQHEQSASPKFIREDRLRTERHHL